MINRQTFGIHLNEHNASWEERFSYKAGEIGSLPHMCQDDFQWTIKESCSDKTDTAYKMQYSFRLHE